MVFPSGAWKIGTYEILIGEARASEAIRKTEFRTDVIGSNTRLAGASLEMIDLPLVRAACARRWPPSRKITTLSLSIVRPVWTC